MLLLKSIIAVTAILSASAQTTSSSSSLAKTASPSTTSVAQTRTSANAPPAPQPTGSPSEKRATRKLSEDFELGLLKDMREKMTFLPYTPEERVFVAQQRQETLNVYSNIEEKIKNYGVDAIATFSDILKNASNMTNKDFSYVMARHSLSLRDFHTNFEIGGQHSCYSVGTPYEFDFVMSDDIVKNPQIVVRAVSQDPDVGHQPGVPLDTIDGKSFRDYWLSVQNMTGGANQFGGYRQALSMLMIQYSATHPLPTNNEIEFGFRQGTGKSTIVKVPYVAQGSQYCIRNAPKERDTPPPLSLHQIPKMLAQTYHPHRSFPAALTITIIRGPSQVSFNDDNLSATAVLDVMRTLLMNTLSNTDGILFDVRGNGGGNVQMAQSIIQWFSGKIVPDQTRAINHPTNRIIFGNQSLTLDDFRANRLALESAAPTDKFAKPVRFFGVDTVNMDGHDNGAAIIFGEDPQTGAGGANVLDQRRLRELAPTIFKPFPFEGSLGKDANNRTIPIPGYGGPSGAVIRKTVAEFAQTQGEVFPQFEHIAMRLKQQAAKDGRSNLLFQSPFGVRFLTNFTIPFNASGFDRIEVRDSKGTLVVDQKFSPGSDGCQGALIPTKKPAEGWDRYNIIGFKGSQTMMTTKRPIVVLPDLSELPEIAAGKSIMNPPLVILNDDDGDQVAAPKDGWQKNQDGTFSIRPTNIDSVHAQAVFPFKVGKGATLNIKADIELRTPADVPTPFEMTLFRSEPTTGIISNGDSIVNDKLSFTDKVDFTVKNMTRFNSGFALLSIVFPSLEIKNFVDRSAEHRK
ncbi:hypothetical protein DFS34DRAFT_593163 [Phlyctochytrium arcticum]|nr:hypothetical protein DFS34DRAFT_593163 [Phlyctochytrium arcticum]